MPYLLNGATGRTADILLAHNMDAGCLRPFIGRDGHSYMTLNTGGFKDDGTPETHTIRTNAAATLRKEDWVLLDRAIIKAAMPRLNAVADLRALGLQYTIPNGMSKTVLEHEAQSDIGPATISMDGLRRSDGDRPVFDLRSLPLPITHKDFGFSARQLAASRNGGSPLDTTTAEAAGRKVAEEIEKLTLGESSTYSFGGGVIYGYKNFPSRLTKSLTAPSSSNHPTTVTEVLAMMKQASDNNYFGPYTLYYSPAWYSYMNEDYSTSGGNNNNATLLSRLNSIQGLTCKPADYLTGTTLLLVQQTADVARVVVGMDLTTVQWETQGGMEINFKVMAIIVPQLRADYSGQCGIVHGSV